MRFQLLDRVTAHEPGKFLRGSKSLTFAEEYLADHFPRFPVMPGVLMLQALVEAATWLVRATHPEGPTVLSLREVKNVRYGAFLQPGRRLDVAVDWVGGHADFAQMTFRGKGTDDLGQQTVAAAFALTGYSLSEQGPAGAAADLTLRAEARKRFALLNEDLTCPPFRKPVV